MRSLIRAFASCLNILWLLSYWPIIIGVSNLKRRLHRLVWIYSCQNATLLEITCHGSNVKYFGNCELMMNVKRFQFAFIGAWGLNVFYLNFSESEKSICFLASSSRSTTLPVLSGYSTNSFCNVKYIQMSTIEFIKRVEEKELKCEAFPSIFISFLQQV